MNKIFSSLLVAVIAVPLFGFAAPTAQAATINTAIRGQATQTVYWYAPDGKRYTFPNSGTFYTWFPSFEAVRDLTDAEIQSIPLGNQNVTYRPGAKLVKINTDPKVYAVSKGAILRHVTSESLASQLFGSDWRLKINDVPEVYFTNYTVGSPIYNASDYNVSNEYNSVTYPHESLKGTSTSGSTQSGSLTMNADRTSITSGQAVYLNAAYNQSLPTGGRLEIRLERNSTVVQSCTNTTCSVTVYPTQESGYNTVQYFAIVKDQNGNQVAMQYSPVISFNGSTTGTAIRLSNSVSRTTVNSGDSVTFTSTVLGSNLPATYRIEIIDPRSQEYINGSYYFVGFVKQTCWNTTTCTVSATMDQYMGRTGLTFGAVLRDGNGNLITQESFPTVTITSNTPTETYQHNGEDYITRMTLEVDRTSVASGDQIRLTVNAFNVGNWTYTGNRIEIRDTRTGSTIKTCNDQSWCVASGITVTGSNGSTAQYEARIYDRNGRFVMSQTSPTISISGTATGSSTYTTSGSGSGSVNGLVLETNDTNVNTGDSVRLTANAYTNGSMSYSGYRLEIRDVRDGSIVRTCYDQSSCATDVTVVRRNTETQAQYEARLYDRNGSLVMSQFSPVIYFYGTGSGSSSGTGSTGTALTGSATIAMHPSTDIRVNGTVFLNADVQSANVATPNIVVKIYDERSTTPLATCTGALTCVVNYFMGPTPISTRVYAVVSSNTNPGSFETARLQLTTN